MVLLSHATTLGGTAPVVRDRRHVTNQSHLEAHLLQGAERAFAASSRTLHEHGHRAHAMLHRTTTGFFRRELRRERRALARALEAARTRAGPRNGRAIHVR